MQDDNQASYIIKKRRKKIRLNNFNYSSRGVYFITVCTADRRLILWKDVGDFMLGIPKLPREYPSYTIYGQAVFAGIKALDKIYDCVSVDNFCIMPNHVHLLICIHNSNNPDNPDAELPTVSRVMQQFKGAVTKSLGISIWQKSFYDHIIRDDYEYAAYSHYIDINPDDWEIDQNP